MDVAAKNGHLSVVRFMVSQCGYNVNHKNSVSEILNTSILVNLYMHRGRVCTIHMHIIYQVLYISSLSHFIHL